MHQKHTQYTVHSTIEALWDGSCFAISKALMHKFLHLTHTHSRMGIQNKNVHNECGKRYIESVAYRHSKLEHFPVNNANIGSPNCSKRGGCGCRERERARVRVHPLLILQNIDTCAGIPIHAD